VTVPDHVLRLVDGQLALNAVRPARGGARLGMTKFGEMPRPLLDDVARYRDLERDIERAYESGADASLLEHRAAELLERVEGAQAALEEEGGGEESHEPFVNLVEEQLADVWRRVMSTDPHADRAVRREVEEFVQTRRLTRVPGQRVVTYGASGGRSERWVDAHDREPPVVQELRIIVGNPDADGRALLEAAREAYEARRQRVRRLRAAGRSGAVEEARAFVERAQARRRR
jgi:hypothetical protein